MEDKLKEILDDHEKKIQNHEKKVDDLLARMEFCKTHNFSEEYRIAYVKYEALNMSIYRWREMHTEIKELLYAWLS